jgi:hypothetical protein
MDTTTTATALAAIAGLAAYINGKYHLAQDLKVLRFKSKSAKYYQELGRFHVPLCRTVLRH